MNDLEILNKIAELKMKLTDENLHPNTQALINNDIRYWENTLNMPEHYRENLAPKADILKLVNQEQELYREFYNTKL